MAKLQLAKLAMTLFAAAVLFPAIARGQSPAEVESLLKKLDTNGDGVISPGEVPARTQLVLNNIAKQAGMEGSGSLTISKVMARLQGDNGDERDGDRGSSDRGRDDRGRYSRDRGRDDRDDRDRGDRNRSEAAPLVPGFGETIAVVGPPGFGAEAGLALVALEERYNSRVIEYVDKILERYDRNKNSMLEPEEVKEARWSSDPKESDANKDGILTKAELCERIAARYGGRSDDEDEDRSSSGARSSSSSSRTGSSSGGSSSSDAEKYRKYAEALIKQNDKNGNGVLEKEEWENVRVAEGADISNDGVITVAELTAKLSGYNKANSSPSSSSSNSSSRSDSRDSGRSGYSRDSSRDSRESRYRSERNDDSKDSAPTIRFLTAAERLPRGLPDWFLKADQEGNNDGQVHLSEYADSAADFRTYDLNNDGFVTPAECLAAAERKAR